MKVSAYEISNGGVTTWAWLCEDDVASRKASGWTVKAPAPLPARARCQDCIRHEQTAPGYVTPTPDFVPPSPDSRLPSRAEVARMPGVAPMKPWPKLKPRKQEREAA